MGRVTRRGLVTGAGLTVGGAAVGALAGTAVFADRNKIPLTGDHLPLYEGYSPAIGPSDAPSPRHGQLNVHWSVRTSAKKIALTFDDGPGPHWTPQIHDILDQKQIPATFFMVGENVRAHGNLIKGRMARHEAGNHTWQHHDLGQQDHREARTTLERTHKEITAVTGQQPELLRPPYGHLGGATLRAAADLGYQIALWSLEVRELRYANNPAGLADYIVKSVTPGTILLAHDLGDEHRVVTLRALPAIIDGVHKRGFEFVTVSNLIAAGS